MLIMLIAVIILLLLALFEKKVNLKKRYEKFYDKFNLPTVDFIAFLVGLALDIGIAYLLSLIWVVLGQAFGTAFLIYMVYILIMESNYFEKEE